MNSELLIFGDSLADNLSVSGYDTTCASHSGATTYQLTFGFPCLATYVYTKPWKCVVFIAGTNDIGQYESDVATSVSS